MVGLPWSFYLEVGGWALVLHGLWEYGQVIPLYRCWERWTSWQRLWVLPAATLGDAVATLAFAAGTAAILGPTDVQPLNRAGSAMLLGVGFVAGMVFETCARWLGLWRYKDTMPTLRVAGHEVGLVPVLQMTVLPVLSVWMAG